MKSKSAAIIDNFLNEWKSLGEKGYGMTFKGAPAILHKFNEVWFLSYKGIDYDLGRKASFTKAERILANA